MEFAWSILGSSWIAVKQFEALGLVSKQLPGYRDARTGGRSALAPRLPAPHGAVAPVDAAVDLQPAVEPLLLGQAAGANVPPPPEIQ